MTDDIFDRYSRGAKSAAPATVATDAEDDVFGRYAAKPAAPAKEEKKVSPKKEEKTTLQAIREATSGFNNRLVSSMPIVGPMFDRAAAAAGAAIQPALPKQEGQPATFAERYGSNLEDARTRNRLYGEENPYSAVAADVAGGTLALAPAAATTIGGRLLGTVGNSLAARVYQGVAGGGLIGASDAALRGEDALTGAAVGSIGGALGPMAGEALVAGGNRLLSWLPVKSGLLKDVNSVGRKTLVNALEGETPQSLAEAQARYGRAGMLADVNDATTDVAGGLADIPGPHKAVVREAYRDRARGQGQRILDSLDQYTVPHTDIAKLTNSIENARSTEAGPLYDQFRTMQVQPSKELKGLVPRLEKAGAFDLAEELSGISGKSFNKNYFTPGKEKSFPTAEGWDYVKRGLDRRISSAQDAGDKELYRELVGLKKEMIDEIGKTPAGKVWAQAREKFAEHSELIHQLEEGHKTFLRSTRKDDLATELNGLSTPELNARVQGARDAIQQILENSLRGDTTARNTLLTKANRDKLEMLFGNDKAGSLIRDLEAEVNVSAKNQNVIGGSQTTPKKERVNSLLPAPSDMGYFSHLDWTKPASYIPEFMHPQAALEGARAARHAKAYEQIAPLITTKMEDPAYAALLDAILNEGTRQSMARNRLLQAGAAANVGTNTLATAYRRRLQPPVGPAAR
ncbi:hypothetical protein [Bradyrhizobium neotropicale]|uniref:hypothetical protein n=1 Tax=Bradyrhizobium neotropicale TaxID=1497615 RepID=UPI001AD78C3D|nr:hypothetical protein [Bradyrhizobium neotropicale]MBO4227219.1 hypothetical protein [Bradyrhizobium neotropicale]